MGKRANLLYAGANSLEAAWALAGASFEAITPDGNVTATWYGAVPEHGRCGPRTVKRFFQYAEAD